MVEAVDAVFGGSGAKQLNQLAASASLNWREVDAFRAYIGYMGQIMPKVAPMFTQEIILNRPSQLVRELTDLFRARFNPDLSGDRAKEISKCEDIIEGHLRRILTHDEDLVFQPCMTSFDRLRTNFYRTDLKQHYLSFKFNTPDISELNNARHYREIFVHHKDVEGVHIRFGPFLAADCAGRTEVTIEQRSWGLPPHNRKNVVIVPEGSKGGFYLKNPSSDPMERRKDADRLYQVFISGLLDVTDNVVDGVDTNPPRTVCHDDVDPYLVVAADKGTAHLSDTANAISQSYNFWLGDAFASGGSNGYDHKAVGITARGAWVFARRHFAEMGRDPYNEPFTCVGIGDCGGDVFGNGMIETEHTRLLAAFNHIHIFLDPNPDAATSYKERKRLFESGGRGGGWNNYNTKLISKAAVSSTVPQKPSPFLLSAKRCSVFRRPR